MGARPEWIPNAYGFDTSYGTLTGAADPWTHKYRKGNPYEDTWHRDGKLFNEEGNATELVAAEALRHIKASGLALVRLCSLPRSSHTCRCADEYKAVYKDVKFHEDPVKNESRLRIGSDGRADRCEDWPVHFCY